MNNLSINPELIAVSNMRLKSLRKSLINLQNKILKVNNGLSCEEDRIIARAKDLVTIILTSRGGDLY